MKSKNRKRRIKQTKRQIKKNREKKKPSTAFEIQIDNAVGYPRCISFSILLFLGKRKQTCSDRNECKTGTHKNVSLTHKERIRRRRAAREKKQQTGRFLKIVFVRVYGVDTYKCK